MSTISPASRPRQDDCDRIGFHAKYTATFEFSPGVVGTFYWDNKAECQQAAQQHGVQCTRVQ
jgi:hypothetical protein